MVRKEKSILITGAGILNPLKVEESEENLHSIHYPETKTQEYTKKAEEYYKEGTAHDSSWTDQKMTEFYRNNRRITYKLCWQMIDENDLVYYCAFVEFPGKWLASSVRWCEWEQKIFPKLKKYKKILNLTKKSYDSQAHAEESCFRHLVRQDMEKYLGKCSYSVTFYQKLTRISIPHEEKFMIILNVENEFKESYDKLHTDCLSQFLIYKNTIINLCNEKIKKIKSHNIPEDKILWDFYSSDPTMKNLADTFKCCFKTNENINYASLGTIEGIPLVRYEPDMKKRILISYDEFEFFIGATHRQKRREKISEIFEEVDYTITVYDKLVEFNIPLEKEFLLVIIMENNISSKQHFFPPPIATIFDTIKKRDWKAILANY